MQKEFSAGGIVIKKGSEGFEALVIKDAYGSYAFPKGHIEENESIEEAAKREISEEVGIKNLKLIADLGVNEHFFTDKYQNNQKIHKFVNYFLFETTLDAKATPQSEEGISDPRWIKIDNLTDAITYANLKEITKKAVQILKEHK